MNTQVDFNIQGYFLWLFEKNNVVSILFDVVFYKTWAFILPQMSYTHFLCL